MDPLFEAVRAALPDSPVEAVEEAVAAIRRSQSMDQRRTLVSAKIRETYTKPAVPPRDYPETAWIVDLFEDRAIIQWEGRHLAVPFTVSVVEGKSEVTLGEAVEVEIAYLPLTESVTETELRESVQLLEAKAVNKDGTARIKIIAPGQGSSGFYLEETLKRDGPAVFPKGTKMFWDHPTATERKERPERSLRDLAAVLESDPVWDAKGADGPGLYATAKVMEPYRTAVEELASTGSFGVSIRTDGVVRPGIVNGQKRPVVEKLVKTPTTSVDFVTAPGAGGKVLALFESAGMTADSPTRRESMDDTEIRATVEEAVKTATDPLRTENARLREALVLRDARDFVTTQLASKQMPELTRARLVESLAGSPVLDANGEIDRAAFAARIEESAKTELDYIARVAGTGRVVGMAATFQESAPAESEKTLNDAFTRLLGSEKAGAVAANGRV